MARHELSDAILVKNYVGGDEIALATLIERHQAKIYGFIYSKIQDRDVCEDVFQDTFVKVIKTFSPFKLQYKSIYSGAVQLAFYIF